MKFILFFGTSRGDDETIVCGSNGGHYRNEDGSIAESELLAAARGGWNTMAHHRGGPSEPSHILEIEIDMEQIPTAGGVPFARIYTR